MSLTHLRSFIAVAEEGHVGRAAHRLALTQPPLSRHILALEDELGARLFERTPRGMRLLPAGEAFLPHARRIFEEVDAAVRAVKAALPAEEQLAALGADGHGGVVSGSKVHGALRSPVT